MHPRLVKRIAQALAITRLGANGGAADLNYGDAEGAGQRAGWHGSEKTGGNYCGYMRAGADIDSGYGGNRGSFSPAPFNGRRLRTRASQLYHRGVCRIADIR